MFEKLYKLLENENKEKCEEDKRYISYCLINESNNYGMAKFSHGFLSDDIYTWENDSWTFQM